MKKIISLVLVCLLCISVVACSNGNDDNKKNEKMEKVTEAPAEDNKKDSTEKETEATKAEKETEAVAEEETDAAAEKETEAEKEAEDKDKKEDEEAKADSTEGAKLEGPYIITTCGQSPGAVQIGMAAKMAGTTADSDNTLTEENLDTETYKTLIVTTGTSMKGMGAAGTDVNKEIERCVAIVKKAQEAGMKVVGAHVEGMSRRMDNSDQASIDAIMELVDTILIVEASNEDDFFTKYAEENSKELIIAKDAIAIGDILK
ncbi:MAG: DUF6305 family protein [Eubacteriales bacterium]|nr:DUF6305 family protein [Eubacteriales bacterium]